MPGKIAISRADAGAVHTPGAPGTPLAAPGRIARSPAADAGDGVASVHPRTGRVGL